MKTINILFIIITILILPQNTLFGNSISNSYSVLKSYQILSGEVEVTADLIKYDGMDISDVDNELYIYVTHDKTKYELSTCIFDRDIDSATAELKKTVGWKDNFLFVRSDSCGGNAWCNNIDHVFTLRENQLVHIGEVCSGEERKEPGAFYNDGYFKDFYDKFEGTSLTSHANSPFILLILKEENNKLVVSLEQTWNNNQEQFKRNKSDIEKIKEMRFEEPIFKDRKVSGPLLFNAILSKYCNHETELRDISQEANIMLSEESFNKFNNILSSVVAGELSKKRRIARKITASF
ncbi:MAG: hypothetical protein HY807_10235 [Nitrospirae bacterium]|nr:hypothetical protein [Nitrospirota bacterium]